MTSVLAFSGGPIGLVILSLQGILFFAALLGLRTCFKYYENQLHSLRELEKDGRATRSSSNDQLNNLLDDYDTHFMKNPGGPNINALVAKHIGDDRGLAMTGSLRRRISRPAFIKFVAGSLIGLGLLGTFIGFHNSLRGVSTSLQSMQSTYSQLQPETDVGDNSAPGSSLVSDVLEEIGRPLDGMTTAFATSLAGLLLTLIISWMQASVWNFVSSRRAFAYELHSFLNTHYLERTGREHKDQTPAYLKGLEKAAEKIASSLATHVDSGFIRVGDELFKIAGGFNATLERLKALLDQFSASAQGLQGVADSFQGYVQNTDSSLKQLESMLEAAQSQSALLASQVRELLNPMSRFADSVENSVLATTELQSVVEDTGQEILGILSSSVSDFARVSTATEEALAEFTSIAAQLPGTVMESSAEVISQALMPCMESLVSETEEAQQAIAESWQALKTFESSMHFVASSAASRFGQQTSEALNAAMGSIKDQQELSNMKIIESARILYGQTAKAISENVAKLSKDVSQLAKANRSLIEEMRRIFMIDELSGVDNDMSENVADFSSEPPVHS